MIRYSTLRLIEWAGGCSGYAGLLSQVAGLEALNFLGEALVCLQAQGQIWSGEYMKGRRPT
jgi:hypothetical protein